MAQATNTTEWVFDTSTATLATNTTLATATRLDFASITIFSPETTGTRTMRSVELICTFRSADTAAAVSVDGCRLGITLGAAGVSDLDVTGTGIVHTGDEWAYVFSRDVTSYFVTNFGTGASQTCVAAIAVETSAASLINNITAKIRMTYEFDNTSATFCKTVRIPLEGNTGFLTTTANTNIQGSSGAAQIPNLDTFLPEATKTYRSRWFEIWCAEGSTATTDFNMLVAIDSGSNSLANCEQVLNTSVFFYTIFRENAFTTSATHNFQAWSTLASRFETISIVLCVSYEYSPSSSSTIINSLVLPVMNNNGTNAMALSGTAAGDQDVWEISFYIAEPTTITLVQSGLVLMWENGGAGNVTPAVTGAGRAGGAQGTTSSTYTGTSFVQAGQHSISHRIDLAHGGSAVTLGRGWNTLRLKIFGSNSTNIWAVTGKYYLNYTSGKATNGPSNHNHTTWWIARGNMVASIAGDSQIEISTASQQTPNIPEASYYLQNVAYELSGNHSGASVEAKLQAESLSGESLGGDGWVNQGFAMSETDGEISYQFQVLSIPETWKSHPNDPRTLLAIETARKYRIWAELGQWGLTTFLTYSAITFVWSGSITGSAGGTVTINGYRTDTGDKRSFDSTTRVGNGTYSLTWYDSAETVFSEAREDATHIGRSDNGTAA